VSRPSFLAHDKLPRVTFTQLRVLQAVARTGNMTRAADQLATSQPAVSHAIRNLEQELGLRLVSRGSGGVELTAAGRVAAERAATILNQLEALADEMAVARGTAAGRLRIGTIRSVNAHLLPAVLGAFRSTHPSVELTVLEGTDSEVLEWLLTAAVDVAIVTTPHPNLATTLLASDRMLAVVAADHALASQPAVGVGDLARYPFIMPSGGCEPLISAIAERAGVHLRRHYSVGDAGSMVTMVAEHLGVTIMPELSLPATMPRVTAVPLEPAEHRAIFLAVVAAMPPLPTATAFIDIAAGRHAGTS
jgi:DNA-binding transcriptional LysR family regulator